MLFGYSLAFGRPSKNPYELEPEEPAKVKIDTGLLDRALNGVGIDHEFLLAGDVFTRKVLEISLAFKRKHEGQSSSFPPAGVRPLL